MKGIFYKRQAAMPEKHKGGTMQQEATNNRMPDHQSATSAVIIANPASGTYEQIHTQLEDAQVFLQEHGWDVTIKLTEGPGDGKRLAQEAVNDKRDVVIATGGDGTINEIIQALAGSDTALGILPSGTVNVWAREIGVPLNNIKAASEILINGQIRRIDLGQVNERYFLLMATIGFDAEVTRTVENLPKKLGVISYIIHGTWLGLGYPNFTIFMQTDGRTIRERALQVVFGNTQLYAGTIKFTWQAKSDDGLIDISLVRSQGVMGRFAILLDFLLRRKRRTQWVRYDSAKEIKVHANQRTAIQVDGDPEGYTNPRGYPPTTIRVMPGALKVIIPQSVPENLFSNP